MTFGTDLSGKSEGVVMSNVHGFLWVPVAPIADLSTEDLQDRFLDFWSEKKIKDRKSTRLNSSH